MDEIENLGSCIILNNLPYGGGIFLVIIKILVCYLLQKKDAGLLISHWFMNCLHEKHCHGSTMHTNIVWKFDQMSVCPSFFVLFSWCTYYVYRLILIMFFFFVKWASDTSLFFRLVLDKGPNYSG